MKRFAKFIAAFVLSLSLCGLSAAYSGALVTASLTGRVWGKMMHEDGKLVRFTIRENGWPNELRDIVIRPSTHIYYAGHPDEWLSPNVLFKGEGVRCQGGMTFFMDRQVAQRIIILHRA